MNQKIWNCIGIMSGTSLDGLDLVFVRFTYNNGYSFQIIASQTVTYSNKMQRQLKHAITFSEEELKILDKTLGNLIAEKCNAFITKNKLEDIDFIASHGHTVFHDPSNGITLQIGAGQQIASKTGLKVICDFRSQDVLLGGQGAPLVPIGDRFLFSEYEYCLNLGGFSNISSEINQQRIAYDICPVNIVLNHYANKLGLAYDDKGNIAASGTINKALLEKLNALAFYKKAPPKSLGLEWVEQYVFPLIDNYEDNVPIILRTYVAHVAIQISKVFKNETSVLVTGGGVFNTFLMQKIQARTNAKICIPSKTIVAYKEALIFAFLGLLRSENQVNCLKSVTGASKDHSSGLIFNS